MSGMKMNGAMGGLFAPAWHRPWLRYIDVVDGAGVTPPVEEKPAEPATASADAPLGEGGVKALKAEREARAAEKARADELAAKLQEIEDRDKSEAQKNAEELERLRSENAGYKTRDQARAWAEEIVKDSPIPASALRGATREELEAHFKELEPLIKVTTPAPAVVPTIGQSPQNVGNVPLKDQIAAAEATGDKALVAALKAQMLAATN